MAEQHPQAHILRAVAASGEVIQRCVINDWEDVNASFALTLIGANRGDELRIKPRTIQLGTHEVIAPMSQAPKDNEPFFFLSLTVQSAYWSGTPYTVSKAELCWKHRQDAELVAQAFRDLLKRGNT